MNFAITLVCGMLPRIVFGPIAGVIANRINRKALVVGSELLSCLVMMGASLIAYTWGPSLLLLYVPTMFLAICSTFFSIAFSAAIPTIVEDERIQNAGALNQAASSFSSILGPICRWNVLWFCNNSTIYVHKWNYISSGDNYGTVYRL